MEKETFCNYLFTLMSFQTHMQLLFQLHTKVAFQEDLGYNLSHRVYESNFYVFLWGKLHSQCYMERRSVYIF